MEWLKQALAAVYKGDGLVGIVVVLACLAVLLWLFGDSVLALLGS
jgi:hypothetical protein